MPIPSRLERKIDRKNQTPYKQDDTNVEPRLSVLVREQNRFFKPVNSFHGARIKIAGSASQRSRPSPSFSSLAQRPIQLLSRIQRRK